MTVTYWVTLSKCYISLIAVSMAKIKITPTRTPKDALRRLVIITQFASYETVIFIICDLLGICMSQTLDQVLSIFCDF